MALFGIERAPGFRLNLTDLLVIAACVAASWWIRTDGSGFPLWWVPAYTAASFFLFCNVLRVGTLLELPWVAALALGCGLCLGADWHPATVLLLGEPVRLLVAWWSVRIGWYRGVGWRAVARRMGFPDDYALRPRPPLRWPSSAPVEFPSAAGP